MVEVKNIEVAFLDRAKRAIKNSFNVGEIDTTSGDFPNGVKSLGGNMQPHQSHDAYLKGICVCFDMKGNGVVMPELQRYHFMELIMSQSTMHSMNKFMQSDYDPFTKYVCEEVKELTKRNYRELADICFQNKNSENPDYEKQYEAFETLVHNLPRGFELWFTGVTNYLQLKTIVIQRFHHKNKEDWKAFIEACYSMPEFRELCGFEGPEWDLSNW